VLQETRGVLAVKLCGGGSRKELRKECLFTFCLKKSSFSATKDGTHL
jgi:hypothetical protein